MKQLIYTGLTLLSVSTTVLAQEGRPSKTQFGATVGLNIGATTPVPVPKQIEKVYAWYPNSNISMGFWATHQPNPNIPWGISWGIEGERKSFSATTSVDHLPIRLESDNGEAEFTGYQNTEVNNTYLTIPVLATYSLGRGKWRVHAGIYASLLMSGKFVVKIDGDGLVNDQPLNAGNISTFDFSDHLTPYDFGIRVGGDFFFTKNLAITMKVNFGVFPVTKPNFTAINSGLRNIYGFAGISYRFIR